jgi:hypothetical protein
MQSTPVDPWAVVVTSVSWPFVAPYACMHTYIYDVCIDICFFLCVHLIWDYMTAICLSPCFSCTQLSLFAGQPVDNAATHHIFRAFIAYVSVHVSRGCLQSTVLAWKCWMCVCMYECIWQLFDQINSPPPHAYSTSSLYMQASEDGPEKCADRQTDTVNLRSSTSTHPHMLSSLVHPWAAVVTSVRLALCHSPYMRSYLCVYIYILFLFTYTTIYDSCLSHSILPLHTAVFICKTIG